MDEPEREALVEAYAEFELEVLHHAITVADAKAGFVLGLAVAFVVASFQSVLLAFHTHAYLSASLGALGELGLVIGGAAAFHTVAPRIRNRKSTSNTYWSSEVFLGDVSNYIRHIRTISSAELSDSTLRHLHLIAAICRRKYSSLTIAFYASPIGVLFLALAYLTRPR